MLSFLIGFQIFVAILLVVVILMQNGKGADIGSAFGSGNNNGMLGPIESGNTLTTLTWVLLFVFFINHRKKQKHEEYTCRGFQREL